jgi:nucleoside-diphosphate-sugar epimerase
MTGDPSGPTPDGPARDFVFVCDAARACVALAEAVAARPVPHVEDLTFRSGWTLTDREMAAHIREAFAGRTPHLPAATPANPLSWAPAVSFSDALAETIAWYREFLRTRLPGPKPSDPPHRAAA